MIKIRLVRLALSGTGKAREIGKPLCVLRQSSREPKYSNLTSARANRVAGGPAWLERAHPPHRLSASSAPNSRIEEGIDGWSRPRAPQPFTITSMDTGDPFTPGQPFMMTPRPLRIVAAFVFGTSLLAASALAQTHPAAPESPYGGVTVEDILARVNDQIITHSDYDRAMKEMDDEAKQHDATMQQISEAHRDLLRNLIDQQLWLSKGKELGVNGETELIKRLDEIRKQYSLETLEDLEKAAKEQGVSFEDFKANIRNQIVTQEVMREEVGRRVQFTQGEVERYYEAHKQDFARPESVKLSEILISTGDAASGQDDPAKLDVAKGKADDIEAKLHAGGDFTQLAKTFSDGTTASEGGDLGEYPRGALAKVLEDQTFALQTGQFTEPIRTRQGFVILKVVQHVPAGAPRR